MASVPPECFFPNCFCNDKLVTIGPQRIQIIIESSKKRNDDLHQILDEELKENQESGFRINAPLFCAWPRVLSFLSSI